MEDRPASPPGPKRKAGPRKAAGPRADADARPAPEGERIAKMLARAGVASRREVERMIGAGRIAVNGVRIDSPALNVTGADKLTVDGAPVGPPEPPRLWLYHKPPGLVTSDRDEKGRRTIYDSLPPEMPRVLSVGRLDITSEGLLILTNDGGIKRRLELPATGWVRKYRVRVNGLPDEDRLAPLRRGVTIDGEAFQPMGVTVDRQQGANAWLTVSLREGRNREVRRAMELVGLTVNRLIRVAYGPFRLGDLKPGAVEEVRPRVVRDQLGLEATPRTRPAPRTPGPAKADAPRAETPRAKASRADASKPGVPKPGRARPDPRGRSQKGR